VLHKPEILLLDDPYTGLDPQATQTLTDLLLELAGEGRLILLTTHRISRGLAVGQRMLVLHHGRLVYDQLRTAISPDTFADTYQTITA
jgi:heme exporter protein A